MQCPQCGRHNAATVSYCTYCGTALSLQAVAVAPAAGLPVPAQVRRRLAHLHWPTVLWSGGAGGLGGLLGWALDEMVSPLARSGSNVYVGVFIYFAVVSALLGALLGALPGALNRSRRQATRGALVGAVVAGIGGGLGSLPAQYLYTVMDYGVLGRALGWAIVGACVGLCPGVSTRDPRRALRGLGGGLAGGFLAGLLFELVGGLIPRAPTDTGTASRFVADIVLGICIGLMVAFVEVVARNAWLKVLSGRREGAQFILSRDTTALGRDDRDDVLLWGDSWLALHHARIARRRHAYVLESLTTEAPTLLNGRQIGGPEPLHDGDEITLGSTRLLFVARAASPLASGTTAPPVLSPASTGPAADASADGLLRPALPALSSAPKPQPAPMLPMGDSGSPAQTERTHSRPANWPLPPMGDSGFPAHFRLVALAPRNGAYPLPARSVLRVGRAPDNDIVLREETASAYHADLQWENGRWIVHDKNSTNGTRVSFTGAPQDERPVQRNALREGSTVRFGNALFRLESDLPK